MEYFYLYETIRLVTYPRSMVSADFDNDTIFDIAMINQRNNTVSILLSKADGTFQIQSTYGVGSIPFSVLANDLNNDNRPDLLVTNSGSANLFVLLNVCK